MWEYQIEIIEIQDPTNCDIVYEMNKFGEYGWEIFSVTENIIREWERYGDQHKIVQYTMYMKRLVEK